MEVTIGTSNMIRSIFQYDKSLFFLQNMVGQLGSVLVLKIYIPSPFWAMLLHHTAMFLQYSLPWVSPFALVPTATIASVCEKISFVSMGIHTTPIPYSDVAMSRDVLGSVLGTALGLLILQTTTSLRHFLCPLLGGFHWLAYWHVISF
jgi:hypothetical protein